MTLEERGYVVVERAPDRTVYARRRRVCAATIGPGGVRCTEEVGVDGRHKGDHVHHTTRWPNTDQGGC